MEQQYTIDPLLLAEVAALTERIQEMQSSPERDEDVTVQLKIPRSWLLLAAWMEQLEPARMDRTRHGPFPVPVLDLGDRRLRMLAKRWLERDTDERMFGYLDYLCQHPDWFLAPLSEDWKRSLDGEVPF